MLDKKIWAVVGVTKNKDKFGYKIFKKLKNHGYETFGVNFKYKEVDGEKIYSSLKDIPKKVEVVNIVVPPKVTLKILDEIEELGIKYVWFQPGTFDEAVMEKANKLSFKSLFYDCVYTRLLNKEKID